MPIPDFDYNLVLPPHLGNPTLPDDLSPYKCTTVEFCQKFTTSPERIAILTGFIKFRQKLHGFGLTEGFQWLDGSFLEDKETLYNEPPNDLDLVTVFWGYDDNYQQNLAANFPEFGLAHLSKQNYKLDHYPFDASYTPEFTVSYSRYWIQLFSHNRQRIWKGMLQIALNTPGEDAAAYIF